MPSSSRLAAEAQTVTNLVLSGLTQDSASVGGLETYKERSNYTVSRNSVGGGRVAFALLFET